MQQQLADNAAPASPAETEQQPAQSLDDPLPPLDGARPAVTQLVASGIRLALTGAALGLGVALLQVTDLAAFASKNSLPKEVRTTMVAIVVLGALVFALPPLGYLLFRRSRAELARIERLSHALCPLGFLGPLPLLFDWKTFADRQLLLALALTMWGLGLERALRASLAVIQKPVLGALATACRVVGRYAWIGVLALVVWFAVFCSYYSVMQHYRVQTTSYDLGIFDNLFYNLIHGEWFKVTPDLGRNGGSHIHMHATFAAYVLAPFYALRPQADTLLVMQAVVVGLGAFPFYLLARHRLENALLGLTFAYLYVIYGPIHGPVFYDFHFLTLAPFFIGWTLYFFETGRTKLLAVAWVLTLLLREDMSALLAGAGLFYLLSAQRVRWALAFGVVGVGYFVLMRFLVMPLHGNASGEYQPHVGYYKDMIAPGDHGYGGVLKTMLTNPGYTFQVLVQETKLRYLLELMGPFLLLPLRHSKAWLLLLPAAMFTLISTDYPPPVSRGFQYTMFWVPFLFLGALITLTSWRQQPNGPVRILSAVVAMALAGTVFSYHHGPLFQHNTFKGGFRKIQFEVSPSDRERRTHLYSLIAKIPPHASVLATENEVPHVSNRPDCFTLRAMYEEADYLLINIHEARGGRSKEHMKRALDTGKYGLVESVGIYQLWQRGAPQDKNVRGAAVLGIGRKDERRPSERRR
jgi:uncharacterized membrane protein